MKSLFSELKYPDDFNIKTERLTLKPPVADDCNELFTHTSDNRITEFLAWRPHINIEMTKELIISLQEAQKNDKAYHWLIWVDGKIAGLISLIDVRRQHRSWIINRAELSYWLGIDFQNKGYATEAGKAVLEFAEKNLSLYKVILGHVMENVTSEKLALRLGFEKYGLEPDAFYKNNKWYSMVWYQIIFNNGEHYEKK